MRRLARGAGIRDQEAFDGVEAVETALRLRPRPSSSTASCLGCGPEEVADRLRSNPATRGPLLVLAAQAELGDRAGRRRLRARAFPGVSCCGHGRVGLAGPP